MKKIVTLAAAAGLLGALGCTATVTSEDEGSLTTASEAYSYGSCEAFDGRRPTQAALAMAMADELGQWDAVNDLRQEQEGWISYIGLNPNARCIRNNCEKTKAILALQTDQVHNVLVDGQYLFNVDGFRTEMWANWDRQVNANINAPHPPHKLTRVNTYTSTETCGWNAPTTHAVYKAEKKDGSSWSSSEKDALHNALCFFSEGACGNNAFIHFRYGESLPGCRSSSRVLCISIDPTTADATSIGTTTAGVSTPSYPVLNRAYNPSGYYPSSSAVGTKCLLFPTGKAGKMTNVVYGQSTRPWNYCK